jgi:hypothetical protein
LGVVLSAVDAVEPLSEADLLLATVKVRATGCVRVEVVGRADFTAVEWELLEMGILAGAWEMLDLLDELGLLRDQP